MFCSAFVTFYDDDVNDLCLSVGVLSGAAAGTYPDVTAGRGEEQRAGLSGERQGSAGGQPTEHTTL